MLAPTLCLPPQGRPKALISDCPQHLVLPTAQAHQDASQVPSLHPLPRPGSSYSAQLQRSQNPKRPRLLALPEPPLLIPEDFTSLASLESTCFCHCSSTRQTHGPSALTVTLADLPPCTCSPQSCRLSQRQPPKWSFATPPGTSLLKNLQRLKPSQWLPPPAG